MEISNYFNYPHINIYYQNNYRKNYTRDRSINLIIFKCFFKWAAIFNVISSTVQSAWISNGIQFPHTHTHLHNFESHIAFLFLFPIVILFNNNNIIYYCINTFFKVTYWHSNVFVEFWNNFILKAKKRILVFLSIYQNFQTLTGWNNLLGEIPVEDMSLPIEFKSSNLIKCQQCQYDCSFCARA